VLFIAAVVLLAAYALGLFDRDGVQYTNNMEFSSGEFSYTGSLKNGLFTGDGAINFEDGSSYIGGFSDGRFSGGGVYTFSGQGSEQNSGNSGVGVRSFEGTFQDGQVSGGTFYFGDSREIVFTRESGGGTFTGTSWSFSSRDSKTTLFGTGTLTYNDGLCYTGSFLGGVASGNGILLNTEGRLIYTGSFLNGAFDGKGVYYSPEGWVYEGGFSAGKFDGEGLIRSDASTISGIWEKGIQVSRYE